MSCRYLEEDGSGHEVTMSCPVVGYPHAQARCSVFRRRFLKENGAGYGLTADTPADLDDAGKEMLVEVRIIPCVSVRACVLLLACF